jgi:integrase
MLKRLVDDYLKVRRAMGFDLDSSEWVLRQYAEFATTRGDSHIRTQTAIDWAAASGGTAGQRHFRLQRIVLVARYARAEDPRHEIPPRGIFPRLPRQFLPVIYTQKEARGLIAAAGRLGPVGSPRPHTFAALLALLFATGLRISEALALRFEDITAEGLVIRKTKFRKTRIVPLHETAQAGLQRFLSVYRPVGASSDHIFINLRGKPLSEGNASYAFRSIVSDAGLRRPGAQQPRIHDIRHAFTVRALETAPDGRDRIAEHMLALTTYLGHSHVRNTYWYLQTTPRLLHDIADACEASAAKGGRS